MSARDVMATASRSKLLLWRTIVVSYAEWVRHFSDVMRATGFWIALLSLTMGVADWLSWSIAMSTVAELKSGAPKDPGVRIVVTGILSVFSATVFVLAVVDVAISWHRRVILSEVSKLFGRNLGNTYYWRYFGRLLIVSVVAAAPIALLFLLIAMDIDFEVSVELEIVVQVMASLLLVMTLVIFARISLVLPASHVATTPEMDGKPEIDAG